MLLVSTYELGHQPLRLAKAAAWLGRDGHDIECIDLSVERLDIELARSVGAIACSIPMHTAAKLSLDLVEEMRSAGVKAPIAFFGLYAQVASVAPAAKHVDAFFTDELERSLAAWAKSVGGGASGRRRKTNLLPDPAPLTYPTTKPDPAPLPDRSLLPQLDHYCRLIRGDEEQLTGYVEATHGCSRRCLHCPVPVVYNGRVRRAGIDGVLGDIDQLAAAGARHITFGDPDFLNAPRHAMRVVAGFREAFPKMTFDTTIKIEHIVRHRELFPTLADAGCLFVVSAFESASDAILANLAKGHNRQDMVEAVAILRSAGIEPRASFVPFTPWTEPRDVSDLLAMAHALDLAANIDPVQWAIRLLVPPGSLLLPAHAGSGIFGPLDPANLSHRWEANVPGMDALARELEGVAAELAYGETAPGSPKDSGNCGNSGGHVTEGQNGCSGEGRRGRGACGSVDSRLPPGGSGASLGASRTGSFEVIETAIASFFSAQGWTTLPSPFWTDPARLASFRRCHSTVPAELRPRLSEAWFCCAEPDRLQTATGIEHRERPEGR